MAANPDDRGVDVRATLRNLISASEGLLGTLGEEGTQQYSDAMKGLRRQIRRARDDLDDLQYAAIRRARFAARAADHYVQENPWKTTGAAAAAAAVIGALAAILIARR